MPEREGVPDRDAWAVRRTDDAGRVRFSAVPSDRVYVLWMLPDEDGRTCVRPDVRPDGREVRVRAERGQPTPLRVGGGPDLWIFDAWAVDAHGAVYDVERKAGSRRFPALPPGPWHVVAHLGRLERASDLRSPRRADLVPEEPLGIEWYAETDGIAGGEIVLVPTPR